MRVLLINGSPHKAGCTFTALSTVAGALNAEGVETEIFQLGSSPVHGCTGCEACFSGGKKAGRCKAHPDDAVARAQELFESADGLIIGTPVYYASPNGSLIAFLDRFFYSSNALAFKPAAGVACARRAGTTASLDVLNKYFGIARMLTVGSQYWNCAFGDGDPAELAQDAEGMQILRTLGREMAWVLKCLEAAKRSGVPYPEIEPRVSTSFIR